MTPHGRRLAGVVLIFALAGCAGAPAASVRPASVGLSVGPGASAAASVALARASAVSNAFPTAAFAGLGQEPVSDVFAAELQAVLDAAADGHGLTAAVISPYGAWNGATGMATNERAMVPDDQFAIASVTKSLVAAQVMQLVDDGDLGLDDPAADHLPPDLDFDTNGATIRQLLEHRSGLRGYDPNLFDPGRQEEPAGRSAAGLDAGRDVGDGPC